MGLEKLERDRVIETLEACAQQTQEGARRISAGAALLTTDGVTANHISHCLEQAHFHAAVFGEAARLLRETVTPAT